MKPTTRLYAAIVALAVLALIIFGLILGYPRYKESRLRLRMTDATDQLRALGKALEVYYVEFDRYPAPVGPDGLPLPTGEDRPQYGFIPPILTTPVRYVASDYDLTDPFNNDPPRPIQYAVDAEWCWILTSAGVDGTDDVTERDYVNRRDALRCQERGFFTHWGGDNLAYDPTNGLESAGDLVHLGP